MSTNTTNYNLLKYDQTDYYDIDKHNDNYDIIDTEMHNLETSKAVKGTAYIKGENNVKVVQGVPTGGQFENLGVLAGYLKVKFPTKDHTTPSEFDISIRHVGTESLTAKYRVKCHLPSGNITASYQGVTVIKGTTSDLVVDFCKGATEDYLILRKESGTKDFGYSSIVIDNIHYRGSTADWSTGWGISIVTELETLESTSKTTVTPTLNSTHLGGYQPSLTGEGSKIPVASSYGDITTGFKIYGIIPKKYSGLFLGAHTNLKTFAILLTPVWTTGTVGKSKVKGTFSINKGDSSVANSNYFVDIDIQTAYSTNSINKFDTNLTGLKLGTIVYNDITYYCLYYATATAQLSFTFEGLWYTQDTTITLPTLFSDYATTLGTPAEIDTTSFISEGFFKRTISSVKSLFANIKMLIQGNDTAMFDVQNSSNTSVFAVDTTNEVLTGTAADKKQDKTSYLAKVQPYTWSRVLYATHLYLSGSFIITVNHTRNSVVVGSVFLVYFGHGGKAKITQLSHNEYSNIQVRVVYEGSYNANIYFEIKDTNTNIDGLTSYGYQINVNAMACTSITEYTAFTSGEASTKIGDSFTTVANKMLISGKEVLTDLAKSLNTNGYQKFGNGLVLQWGKNTISSGVDTDVTLPLAFNNSHLVSFVSQEVNSADGVVMATPLSLSQIRLKYDFGVGPIIVCWFAIGY